MLDSGHSIGNHTASHLSMPSLASKENFSKYLEEIISVEDTCSFLCIGKIHCGNLCGSQYLRTQRNPEGKESMRLSLLRGSSGRCGCDCRPRGSGR